LYKITLFLKLHQLLIHI